MTNLELKQSEDDTFNILKKSPYDIVARSFANTYGWNKYDFLKDLELNNWSWQEFVIEWNRAHGFK